MQSLLSRNIRYLRKSHNMSQEELAESLFKSESTIQMWESDKRTPTLESLKGLSILFDVSLDSMVYHILEYPLTQDRSMKVPKEPSQDNSPLAEAVELISKSITDNDSKDFVESLSDCIIDFSNKYKK